MIPVHSSSWFGRGNLLQSPYLLLTLTTLFWAGNITLGKVAALGFIGPFTLSFLRWTIAALILLPFGWRHMRAQRTLYRAHWWALVLPGLAGIAAYNTLQYWALRHTTAINASVIGAAMPGGIFLLTWLLGQERANRWQIFGMVLLIVGVLYVALRGDPDMLLGMHFNIGDVALIVAVALFCVYSVSLRRLPAALHFTGMLTVLIIIGAVGVAPFFLWEAVTQPLPKLSWKTLAMVLYVGIFPSVLAYFCWNRAILLAGANLAALMMNLTVVFVTLLAVLLLDEKLALFHLIGFAMIFSGLFLSIVIGRKAGARP